MTNVGELDQIRGFLRDHPDLHRQSVLYDHTGTGGCVAAWTDALNRGCRAGDCIRAPRFDHPVNVFNRARLILGLTREEASDVFAARKGARGRETTLRLIDALIARDKGDLSEAGRRTLRRYGLPEAAS
jgi:hypothetical protein